MKSLFICCGLLVGLTLNAADTSTNLLSISLVDNPAFLSNEFGSSAADDRVLSPPVLSAADFVGFDTNSMTFTITADAAKRLAKGIWDLKKPYAPGWSNWQFPTVLRGGRYELVAAPVPFVLQVSGQTICKGIVTTPFSSMGFDGPAIMSHEIFITTNQAANVSLSIYSGYPGMEPLTCDSRLASAVKKLFSPPKYVPATN